MKYKEYSNAIIGLHRFQSDGLRFKARLYNREKEKESFEFYLKKYLSKYFLNEMTIISMLNILN